MPQPRRPQRRSPTRRATPDLDSALITLFIGAMQANDHVAPDEAARAHHLIWSTRRFRDKPGEYVGRLIDDVRRNLATADVDELVAGAVRAIPRSARPSAFALLADLLLADGRMDRRERRFLQRTGEQLGLSEEVLQEIVNVMRVKNRL